MEQEHIKEWQRLQETALEVLRGSNHEHGVRLLYLLIMPSWGPVVRYEIYEARAQRSSTAHVVVVTSWQWAIDAAKFDTPIERLKHPQTLTPTLESQSFQVTTEFANEILNKFMAISIPMLPNVEMLGLDGTSYEVGLGHGFVWSCFHWWEEPPSEWKSLGTVFQDTLQELEKAIAVKS